MPTGLSLTKCRCPQFIISSRKWMSERIFLIVIEYWFENKQQLNSHQVTGHPSDAIDNKWAPWFIAKLWIRAVQSSPVFCRNLSSNIYWILDNPFMRCVIRKPIVLRLPDEKLTRFSILVSRRPFLDTSHHVLTSFVLIKHFIFHRYEEGTCFVKGFIRTVFAQMFSAHLSYPESFLGNFYYSNSNEMTFRSSSLSFLSFINSD